MIQRAFMVSVLALAGVGCGPSATSICGDVCDCIGCSEREETDCIDDVEDQQKAAADEGCEDQHDALLSCYADQLECRDGDLDIDGCDSEEEELSRCAGGGVGGVGGSVCDRAVAICSQETGGSGNGSDIDCSGATECSARCIVDANSCDTSDDGLIDCLSGCSGGASGPDRE